MSDYVTRQVRFDTAGTSDGRTLTGLAVPFNEITRISNPWEGTFDEQFAPGAFKRTLDHRTPKLQFNHGTSFLYDELPIGSFTRLEETDAGLEVEARVFGAPHFEPLREAIAGGAIDGMSIRFRPIQVEVTQPDQRADDGDVELHELGPVVFPAYEGTTVDVRANPEANRLAIVEWIRQQIAPHDLALALSGREAHPAGGSGTNGLGTDPEAGSPAVRSDPDSLHSDRPPRNRRANVVRLHRLRNDLWQT